MKYIASLCFALIEHNEYNSKILEDIKNRITVSFLMIRENFFLIKKNLVYSETKPV